MAKYTDIELIARVNAVLYANGSGEIDATELRDLLLDFVDSKLNADASIGTPVHGTISADDLIDNAITLTHNLSTDFPVVFIKSNAGDVWVSEIHYTVTPSGANTVLITFEEDLATGTSVEYIVVKYA